VSTIFDNIGDKVFKAFVIPGLAIIYCIWCALDNHI